MDKIKLEEIKPGLKISQAYELQEVLEQNPRTMLVAAADTEIKKPIYFIFTRVGEDWVWANSYNTYKYEKAQALYKKLSV